VIGDQLVIGAHLLNNELDDSGIAYTTDLDLFVANHESSVNPHRMSIYPNPVSEKLFIDPGEISVEQIQITIYGSDGRPIKSSSLKTETGTGVWSFDVAGLIPGIYFIHVSGGNHFSRHKWVKL
jgi:hypothetical protein